MTHARMALNRFRSATGKPSAGLSLPVLLSISDDDFYGSLQRILNQSLTSVRTTRPVLTPAGSGRA